MTAFAGCDIWAAREYLARTRPKDPLPPPCDCDPHDCPPLTKTEEPS